jgi:gluconokinase
MTLRPEHRIVIMGVSGCGKSSVGESLAKALGIPYRDGDDLHTPQAVQKMREGTPLTDDDRWPWLDRVAAVLAAEAPVIVGCSALRRIYRDRIRANTLAPVQFIHLSGSREVIAARMAARTGHYMPTALLDSQFAALDPPGPDEAITVTIDQPLDAIVTAILPQLKGHNT